MTAKDHNKLLGIFHLILGGLQAFGGVFLVLIYGVIGFAVTANAHRKEEQIFGTVFIVVAVVAGVFALIFAGINLMSGYKMFKEKAGARTWGIVASIICLMGFPLGTALGIYGLWFLFGEEGKQFYGNSDQNYSPPVPPQSWQ